MVIDEKASCSRLEGCEDVPVRRHCCGNLRKKGRKVALGKVRLGLLLHVLNCVSSLEEKKEHRSSCVTPIMIGGLDGVALSAQSYDTGTFQRTTEQNLRQNGNHAPACPVVPLSII